MGGDAHVIEHIFNHATSVMCAVRDDVPYIAYLGDSLGEETLTHAIFHRGVMGGGLDTEIVPALISLPAHGWMGLPGVEVSRNGTQIALDLRYESHQHDISDNSLQFSLKDSAHDVSAELTVHLHPSNVVVLSMRVTNDGHSPLTVNSAHLCIPIGQQADELLTLGGRHAMEAVQQRTQWGRTKQLLENRSGRTSHEQLGVVFAGTPGFTEQTGDVWGVHVAWSGNFRLMCDGITDTRKTIHVGELLQPNEVVLHSGESYSSPDVVVSFSPDGLSGVSQNFHRYMRSFATATSRPVVLNTWEAVYFNHDLDTLQRLATVAAGVGVERFVLDDGWLHGRRNDTAGLGDWWVDNTVWPNGLAPLISHVRELGMEFGLWFEPEMVNPNSDLFRAHPHWALDGTVTDPILGRHQLVLNMSLPEVRDYLFEKIDALLSTYDIAYVKWDHNRPLVGGASHHQTHGFYELLQRLTTAHPHVQFESCASGGGRIDMGVARWVRRFWASDSIDALDRLEIQKGLTTFVPPEMLGAHIGSPTCHTTGRKHALSFRAASALFGWMGVEWNLLTATEKELTGLENAISFYKKHRDNIGVSEFIRVDHPDSTIDVRGIVHPTEHRGLFTVSRLWSGPSNHSAPLRLPVHPQHDYNVQLIYLGTPRWALHREQPQWVTDGDITVSGRMLSSVGVPMPSLLPESSFIISLHKVAQQ